METKFNFNSQICTTREQSERLLALGLRKETADMFYAAIHNGTKVVGYRISPDYNDEHFEIFTDDIPAWSLNRLIEMIPEYIILSGQGYYISIREHCVKYVLDGSESNYIGVWSGYTLYDKLINCIEWLIKEGYFNKEYLV